MELVHSLGAVVDEYGAMIERISWENGRTQRRNILPNGRERVNYNVNKMWKEAVVAYPQFRQRFSSQDL